ncbi:MAG TPA: hypothetical protein VD886_26125 [Herpetosiphonaceae bacterium]|nr:hypothetical protein [Herpetosiphonaceae bacterium]
MLADAGAWISILALVLAATLLSNLAWYALRAPAAPAAPLSPTRFDRAIGSALYAGVALLAPARAPFALLPAATRWAALRLWGRRYRRRWESPPIQALRALGEALNLWLTLAAAALIPAFGHGSAARALLLFAGGVEAVRLIAQKGQMGFSGAWQQLDHRAAAGRIERWRAASRRAERALRPLDRYCRYYRLSDRDRLALVARALRQRARRDPGASARLRYFGGFRIVPDRHYLRSGHVRDIATGEVFVHRRWTNDPWLLIGQALRRAPWIFDPRYLARPFHYRTGANRLVTLFILRHARYSPPYAWYQVGHELKAASFAPVYWLLRRLGRDAEGLVGADGTYDFDSALALLGASPRPDQRPLWSDDEVVSDQRAAPGQTPSPLDIARRYAYPLVYVEEVLFPRLERECGWEARRYPKAAATDAATCAGASQCG